MSGLSLGLLTVAASGAKRGAASGAKRGAAALAGGIAAVVVAMTTIGAMISAKSMHTANMRAVDAIAKRFVCGRAAAAWGGVGAF